MTETATSPASSGPAGTQFEAEVGATYLLALLNETEPRGLAGTRIERVEFQRAPERPLDDVIVHGRDADGEVAVLEIQVKRGITFSPKDPVFADVVEQIARAAARTDFLTTRYELAIAVAQSTTKIESAYQHVLSWARQLGNAETFMARLNLRGIANEDMRTFFKTVREHLQSANAPADDVAVYNILRRLQILTFDFTAPGSAAAALARELARQALAPEDAARAGSLWTVLIALAIDIAAAGGERDRARLVDDLRAQQFALAGLRRHGSARTRLSEGALFALADIEDQLAGVRLMRPARLDAIREALQQGRFLEIRGDAGVGKSGLLKHLAQELGVQSRIVVFAPQRTTPGGWAALRQQLGFDGSATELLLDLAAGGGATLFVDNLDLFSEGERATVRDLVRAAVSVPGFNLVVTARRTPIAEESAWLPAEALDRLGRAPGVVIDELSAVEIEELRHAAPHLAALLADTHPARAVTRNPYRLSRLARLPANAHLPNTETEMSTLWWASAGDVPADKRRICSRLLRDLAAAELAATTPLDARDLGPGAIDALISVEVVRELAPDRLVFRHDVLREWAAAQLLNEEPVRLEQLPIRAPATTVLARAVELVARMRLEGNSDPTAWAALLDALSGEGKHGSWRRAVLLALVRSEQAVDLLTRSAPPLFADDAQLLRELVGTVLAVEVEPAANHYKLAGVDPKLLAHWQIPRGPAFGRLLTWLLQLGPLLPAAAVPDVAELYLAWCMGLLGQDPLTPAVLSHLYAWLRELENVDDVERPALPNALSRAERQRLRVLESRIRSCFLQFATRTPKLATEYLEALKTRRHHDETAIEVIKSPGSLAECAPQYLADLAAYVLMPEREDDDDRDPHGPFDSVDHRFMPASPAEGPFFALLTHAPEHGLRLIDQLVAHATAFFSRYPARRDEGITLAFAEGERTFPHAHSYGWTRGTSHAYCLTSALLALEAWGHRRIEAGDPIESVLHDVLRPAGSAACFVLVAVDLVLSHWPTTREYALPFLTSPTLLWLDRMRAQEDAQHSPYDPLGINGLMKEPPRTVRLEELTAKASRRVELEKLLPHFAHGDATRREQLIEALRRVHERLGASADTVQGFSDPAFMAEHALNMLDLANWQKRSITQQDGSVREVSMYVSPAAEERKLARLAGESQEGMADLNMTFAIGHAVDDPARSSPAFAQSATNWAQRPSVDETIDNADMQRRAIVGAALVCMRDGSAELRAQHRQWALTIFRAELNGDDDEAHFPQVRLHYNEFGMALAGLIFAIEPLPQAESLREILQVVVRADLAAAAGAGAALDTLARIDPRLPRALLRCAFAGCVRPEKPYGLVKAEVDARDARHQQRREDAVAAELAWLTSAGAEPSWPAFPLEAIRRWKRYRLRIPGPRQFKEEEPPEPPPRETYVAHQTASHWLHEITRRADPSAEPWLLGLVRAYAPWSASLNGQGLAANEEISDRPYEWNAIYFDLLARALAALAPPELEAIVLTPITSLPDESFHDVATLFVKALDVYFFAEHRLAQVVAVAIRTKLVERLQRSGGWRRIKGDSTGFTEVHIGPCIAALLFHQTLPLQRNVRCYLGEQHMEAATALFPTVQPLIDNGPSLYMAILTLNLLEVSPRAAHLPFVRRAADIWLATFPDDKLFWVEHGIGERMAGWIEAVLAKEPAALRQDAAAFESIQALLARLVVLGVSQARRVEELLVRVAPIASPAR